MKLRKAAIAFLASVILIGSVLSVFPLALMDYYDDSTATIGPTVSEIESISVPEHNDGIWAGGYFGFFGQSLQVDGSVTQVVSGDLNQDGFPDLAVVSSEGPISIFFWNTIEKNFSLAPDIQLVPDSDDFTTSDEVLLMAIGDINNDTKNDIVIVWYDTSGSNTFISFLLQDSPGFFYENANFTSRIIPDLPKALLIDNFNENRENDVAIICQDISNTGIITLLYYSPILKKFSASSISSNPIGINVTVACNIDNSTGGPSEIAVAFSSGQIKIFKPPFYLGFSASYSISISGSIIDLESGHLNSDQSSEFPDLLAITESPDKAYIFYRQELQDNYPSSDSKNLTLDFSPLDSAIGDLNGDGFDDIVITSNDPDAVTKIFYQQNGSPRWDDLPDHQWQFPSVYNPVSVAVADFDNNSRNDICLASSGGNQSVLGVHFSYSGRQISSSDTFDLFNNCSFQTDIEIGHFTSAYNEIAILNADSGSIMIFNISADGTLTYIWNFPVGVGLTEIVACNLNGDKYDDIVAIDLVNNTLRAFLGNDTANLSAVSSDTAICLGEPTGLDAYDLNNDGLDDLVVSTKLQGIEIFNNTGTADIFTNTPQIIGTVGENYRAVVAGDIDKNGLPDIVASNENGGSQKIEIFYQTSTGFNAALDEKLVTDGLLPTKIVVGDFDGDSYIDIASAGEDSSKLLLHYRSSGGTYSYDSYETVSPVQDLVSADVSDDNRSDLIAIMSDSSMAAIYVQSESGIGPLHSESLLLPANSTAAAVFDCDGDGRNDIVTVSSGSDSMSLWLQMNRPPVISMPTMYEVAEGVDFTIAINVFDGIGQMGNHSIHWDFGDGDSDSTVGVYSIDHNYSSNGTYTITVNVTDPEGLYSIAQATADISDSIPSVSVDIDPSSPEEGQLTALTANVTSWDGIAEYLWEVDNLTLPQDEATVFLRFPNGTHTIRLSVIDMDGSPGDFETTISVAESAPTVSIISDSQRTEGEMVSFIADVSDPSNMDEVVWFEWDFDYNWSSFDTDFESNSSSAQWSFDGGTTYRNYSVALRANDSDGSSAMCYWNLTIFDSAPDTIFEWSPYSPSEGETITITDMSDAYDGIASTTFYIENKSSGLFDEYEDRTTVYLILNNGSYSIRLEAVDVDGDSAWMNETIVVHREAPTISLSTDPSGEIFEYDLLCLNADVSSFDPIVRYEWDLSFDGLFASDAVTSEPEILLSRDLIGSPGIFSFAVRAYDEDGDWGEANITIDVQDRIISASFADIVSIVRDASDASLLHFNASGLMELCPDSYTTIRWNWDDGSSDEGVLVIDHNFSNDRDFRIEIVLTDDEDNTRILSTTVYMIPPEIDALGFDEMIYARNDTALSFSIEDDRTPIQNASWWVDGANAPSAFQTNYSIPLHDWPEGTYTLWISATDSDGNRVMSDFTVVVDVTPPSIEITYIKQRSYVGSDINITVTITDPNLSPDSVFLHYSFDDIEMQAIQMHSAGDGVYWVVVRGLSQDGILSFYVTAEDLAGNDATSGEPVTVRIVNRFLTEIWPFASIAAILAAVGLFALMRIEAMTAVDETFVIYEDGRLISHQTRRLNPGMDQDVLSGMFIAVQEFVKDSFKGETMFDLRKLEFGEKKILVERGKRIYLAVVLHGRRSRNLITRMRKATQEIETKYSEPLDKWDGDLDKMRGVQEITRRLYTQRLLGVASSLFKRDT
ncbi:MAG TPA: PKD domain-containing protein [Euryarchaeota archaeon]|nr:PKD domain-containing protein [Euryarchaeota archaeon]